MLSPRLVRFFSKAKLPFVQEFQSKLRASNFRERILSPDFRESIEQNTRTSIDALNINQLERCLSEPFWDLANRESKFMRPILISIAADILGLKNDQQVNDLAGFVECIHNTTLILDDIMDSSTTRRGKPCVHLTHGEDIALTCYGFNDHFLIRSIVARLDVSDSVKKAALYECILRSLEDIYIGLAWDNMWHKEKSFDSIPTFENFLLMLQLKTSKLMNLATEMMGILHDIPKEKTRALIEAYNSFGISFQINDDLINIYNEDYSKLKGIGDDIVEGKLSFPILHYIDHFKSDQSQIKRLFDAMNVKHKTQSDINRVLELIKSVDCFDSGTLLARQKMNECYSILEAQFGTHSRGVGQIQQLGEYILSNEFLKVSSK